MTVQEPVDQLSRTDLNRVAIDVDSFLGKAFALGREYNQLPAALEDTLLTYLRAHSIGYAQRYRSGIALDRERIGVGIKQALICVDLALEEQAGGDLNAAVEILAAAQFDGLRRKGWEMAFTRLTQMQRETALLIKHELAVFLQELLPQLTIWTTVIPENWTGINAGQEEVAVDPRDDYRDFNGFLARLEFLRSLPQPARESLLNQWPKGGPFAGVLRHVIVALGLGLEQLAFSAAQMAAFKQQCLGATGMVPAIKKQVLDALNQHLVQHMAHAHAHELIGAAVETQITVLETTDREALDRLFLDQIEENRS